MGGRGIPEFCARCAAESEVQIPSVFATLCGKESSLSVPYLQLWSLIGNWIYYALKSHLEMWEGMTAPASPSQIEQTDGPPLTEGQDRCHRCPPQAVSVPSVPAPLLFFGKNRNSDGRERCSTTVPQMLRATTAHLWSFFHINVVGPCPHSKNFLNRSLCNGMHNFLAPAGQPAGRTRIPSILSSCHHVKRQHGDSPPQRDIRRRAAEGIQRGRLETACDLLRTTRLPPAVSRPLASRPRT